MLLVAAVVMVDQGTKWSAGHSAGGVGYVINGGVDRDGPRLLDGVWRSVPVGGALDLVNLVLLAGLAAVAVRARGMVRAGLLMYAAGWASNLADRLGLSYLSAPAAHARGVVDLPWLGGRNVADYAIHAGVATLALAAVLRAAGGPRRVLHLAVAAARRARRAWKPALAVVVAAAAGLGVGVSGQAGALAAARDDARTLEQFVSARGVVLPGCRPDGPVSLTRGGTYLCPVRLPGGQHRVLRLTTSPSLAAPAAVPTVNVTMKEK